MRARAVHLVLLVALAAAGASAADAGRGPEILRERNCTVCHPVRGAGGDSAPDLGVRRVTDWSPQAFAATLWNHGPLMWDEMERLGLEVPALPVEDALDLNAYLSTLWRYDPIGVARFGRDVWVDQQCYRCHAIVGGEHGIGPAVASWETSPDPVEWVRQMWNHAAVMAEELDNEEGVWPVFTMQEFVDLVAYVQDQDVLDPPASAVGGEASLTLGEQVFEAAGCAGCHSFGPGAGKVDLADAHALSRTELAVEMWNHGPLMSSAPTANRVDLPLLAREEMAAVIAYVAASAERRATGDESRGEELFNSKQCAVCHSQLGEAPPLHLRATPYTPTNFAAAVWRHGPNMQREMESQHIRRPEMTAEDIADLLAYLNR